MPQHWTYYYCFAKWVQYQTALYIPIMRSTGQCSSETSAEQLLFTVDRCEIQRLTIGQSEEKNDYGVLSPNWNICILPKAQRSRWKRRQKDRKSLKLRRAAEKRVFQTWPWHTWTYNICGCLDKTTPVAILSQVRDGITRSHPQPKSGLVQGSGPWSAAHAPLDGTPHIYIVQTALTGLWS